MFNIIKDNPGARRKYKALGRGIGSGKGKTSARGGKGQTARSGVALNGFEGGQMPLIRRLPKRGFNSLNNTIVEVINFDSVEQFIKSGKLSSKITISDLRASGLLKGRNARVKLLGTGELKSKFSIEVHAVSNSAKEKLEKAGVQISIVKFEACKDMSSESKPVKAEISKSKIAKAAVKSVDDKNVAVKKDSASKKVSTKSPAKPKKKDKE